MRSTKNECNYSVRSTPGQLFCCGKARKKNYPECCALDIEQIVTVHSIARLAVSHISQVDEPFFLEILKSFLAKTLYLCKNVESFGTGIKKIYALCEAEKININYENEDTAFTLEFSRVDRNIPPKNGEINGEINGGISEIEIQLFELIKEFPFATNEELSKKIGKSPRTVSRLLSFLKGKNLIERVGSNKTGYWKTM